MRRCPSGGKSPPRRSRIRIWSCRFPPPEKPPRALQILGRVDAERPVFTHRHMNGNSVPQGPKLLQPLLALERTRTQARELEERLAPVRVDTDVEERGRS